MPKDTKGKYVFFATKRGLVKKTELDQFGNIRTNGIIAINLEDNDKLIGVRITDGDQHIVLSTRAGQAIRFKEEELRPMGRGTYGNLGMELEKDKKSGEFLDEVVSIAVARQDETLLTVSELGYGKRTEAAEYRLTHRGGKGVITMNVTDRTGKVVNVRQVASDDTVVLITDRGQIIRLPAKQVRITGRNAQGVRLVRLDEGEIVRAVARLAEGTDEEEAPNGNDANGSEESEE